MADITADHIDSHDHHQLDGDDIYILQIIKILEHYI